MTFPFWFSAILSSLVDAGFTAFGGVSPNTSSEGHWGYVAFHPYISSIIAIHEDFSAVAIAMNVHLLALTKVPLAN